MNPCLFSIEKKSLKDQYLDSSMHVNHSSDIQPSTIFDVDLKVYSGEYIEYRLDDGKIIPIVREYKLPTEISSRSS